jgi:hypothetical protein
VNVTAAQARAAPSLDRENVIQVHAPDRIERMPHAGTAGPLAALLVGVKIDAGPSAHIAGGPKRGAHGRSTPYLKNALSAAADLGA